MKWYFFILSFSCYLNYTENASILGVFPLPNKSHFVMFERILRGLAEKGHQIDVLSHYPLKKPVEGYNDISLKGTQPSIFVNFTELPITSVPRIFFLYLMMSEGGYKSCESSLNSDTMKSIRNSQKKYDMVITEIFTTDCMLGWGYHFGVPVVAMTSSVALPWANDRFGNPDNPSYIPTYDMNFSPRMTLYERVLNTISLITAKLMYSLFSARRSNQLAKEFFGEDMPYLQELTYNTSLILVNSHFSTNLARPTVPNFIEVGGIHIKEPKLLNQHFQEVLTTESKGIIYFSMGSMVLTETLPVTIIQAMFDAFAELPYKVVWKADKDYFPNGVKFPENIHFENWMPQLDILCHPNVKLFVSHGGLMGTQEAIYCAVPVIGIPLFADQELNVKQSENMGIAIKVAFNAITKESILEAATKILNNPKYQETANLVSQRFKDRPLSPFDTALYWIEYVLRHKGAPHLRNAGVQLPWYQYHLLDVSLILVLSPIVVAYLLLRIVKLFKIIRNNGKSKKD